MKNKVVKAIVLAGGYSKRMDLKIPKQLVKIGNKPILAHTLDVFQRCKRVDSIILVAHKRIIRQCRNLIKRYGYKKVEQLCPGGATRQESVFNALRKIKDCDYVIIHDGVRPFVSQKTILGVIRAVRRFGAVTCAVKATDTIVEANKSFVCSTLRRDRLWHIQTPQAFQFDLIVAAHKKASASAKILNASDDAQLLLGLKKKVKLIEGSYKNIKITTISDLFLVKKME
jgi:2-C-methyl-D-erythritol 4-phosphate cytidylyltransferase